MDKWITQGHINPSIEGWYWTISIIGADPTPVHWSGGRWAEPIWAWHTKRHSERPQGTPPNGVAKVMAELEERRRNAPRITVD